MIDPGVIKAQGLSPDFALIEFVVILAVVLPWAIWEIRKTDRELKKSRAAEAKAAAAREEEGARAATPDGTRHDA